MVLGNPWASQIKLLFIGSCKNEALFKWTLEKGYEDPVNCTISYKLSLSDNPFSVQYFKYNDAGVEVQGLIRNASYEAHLLCDGNLKSDPLSFKVGKFLCALA